MKRMQGFLIIACFALLLVGCGAATYSDGTYEGQSAVREGEGDGYGDGYGVATVTIKDNAVVDCEFYTYEPDGTVKDENYGKQDGAVANTDFYNKAQRAVQACEKYAEQLVAAGDLSGVDAISGATISYDEFCEAVENALKQAESK